MSAANPGIAAKDTKEETKCEREERILKEFIRGTTSIGFKIADESVEEILVTFSQELIQTIAKADKIKDTVVAVDKETNDKKRPRPTDGQEKETHKDRNYLSPIFTVRVDTNNTLPTAEESASSLVSTHEVAVVADASTVVVDIKAEPKKESPSKEELPKEGESPKELPKE
jgi:hypothetical protein